MGLLGIVKSMNISHKFWKVHANKLLIQKFASRINIAAGYRFILLLYKTYKNVSLTLSSSYSQFPGIRQTYYIF